MDYNPFNLKRIQCALALKPDKVLLLSTRHGSMNKRNRFLQFFLTIFHNFMEFIFCRMNKLRFSYLYSSWSLKKKKVSCLY